MKVGRRLFLNLSTLAACTGVLGAAAMIGLSSLRARYEASQEQYEQLRALYEIGFHAAAIRDMLAPGALRGNVSKETINASRELALSHLERAAEAAQRLTPAHAAGADPRMGPVRDAIAPRLATLEQRISSVEGWSSLRDDASAWLGQVAALAATTQAAIVASRSQAIAGFERTEDVIIWVLVATLGVGVFAGVVQYRSVMRPVRALDGAVSRVANIELAHRVGETGDYEFRRLIRQFNRMTEAISHLHATMSEQVEAKSRQLLRSEQLAGVGCLAAGVAHEVNNPLGIIAGHAQTAVRRIDNAATPAEKDEALARARRTLELITQEAFRCRDLAAQLLHLSQPPEQEPQPLDLTALVERGVELTRCLPIARSQRVELQRRDESSIVCNGHPGQLLQLVINLLTNALEASPDGAGVVVVRLATDAGSHGIPSAILTVSDNGVGMDERTLARAFDPFFTNKPRRGLTGTGLGLSISHAVAQRHTGRLLAHSKGPGAGSTFTLELPLVACDAPRPPTATARGGFLREGAAHVA